MNYHPRGRRIPLLAALLLATPLLISTLDGASRPSPAAIAPPRQRDLFVAGEAGYHTYRIPSLIVSARGTLLAFAEGRRAGAGDAGDIDLLLTRSKDRGNSWSAPQLVGDNGPNTFGNPCPVLDRKTGRIWLLTTQNLGVDREKDILAGTGRSTRTIWVMHSDDDGVTWSEAEEITGQVKRAEWTWYATGPGVGIQIRATGRLVIPANHAEAGSGVHRSHLVYSDDHGATWKIGAVADEGTNESQVVELSDGRLLLNMRNHPPKAENFRMVATSADGGLTLSPARPDSALIEPPAQASVIRVPGARKGAPDRLLFANPASAKRERMTVRISEDEGVTWSGGRVVTEGPAAYSSLALVGDATIGLLYEHGERSPYEKITFARLALDWIAAPPR